MSSDDIVERGQVARSTAIVSSYDRELKLILSTWFILLIFSLYSVDGMLSPTAYYRNNLVLMIPPPLTLPRAPRATWIQTELFLTFPSPALASITILPSVENAGRFRVWMNNLPEGAKVTEGVVKKENGWFLVSDRKIEGGFPEVSPSTVEQFIPMCTN